LGQDLFTRNDTERKDWKKTLTEREEEKGGRVGLPWGLENLDFDSFEETELMDENVRHQYYDPDHGKNLDKLDVMAIWIN